MMKKADYLKEPVEPFQVDSNAAISDILRRMGKISFQGRNFSMAYQIWETMLQDEITIFMGLAGAMVPAGMRNILVYVIEHRLIDCLVSTGANLFHDIHETLGRHHWLGHPLADDKKLKDAGIDRIYDTFASEEEFFIADRFIADFGKTLSATHPYSTKEFLFLLGKHLSGFKKEEGILTSAASNDVPIFCPALGDSSIGIALSMLAEKEGLHIQFDPIEDVSASARMVMNSNKTGVIYIGGGTPKNFIQQTEVTAHYLGGDVAGHTYAVQFTADAPHWGGLSGCTFEEAQSWGKIQKKAQVVSVHIDATIALPLIVSALSQKPDLFTNRNLPKV
jgi:deoxyhypusine synthase